MPNPDILLTRKEFAKRLSLTPRTIWDWIREGKIKAVKIGKMIRIPESEINRLKEVYPIREGKFLEPDYTKLPNKDTEEPIKPNVDIV